MSKKIENNDNNNSIEDINGGTAKAEPSFVLSKDNMTDVARLAARKRVMENEFETLPHGSKIYFIAKNWESSIIEKDPKVKVVNTFIDFKRIFCDADVQTLFIPEDAVITLEKIRKFCEGYAIGKTIFIER